MRARDPLSRRFWHAEFEQVWCEEPVHPVQEHGLDDSRPVDLWRAGRCWLASLPFGSEDLGHRGGGPCRAGMLHRRSLTGHAGPSHPPIPRQEISAALAPHRVERVRIASDVVDHDPSSRPAPQSLSISRYR